LRWPPGEVVSGVSVDKRAGNLVPRDRWWALWVQGCAIRRAGERHSPQETNSRAPDMRGVKCESLLPWSVMLSVLSVGPGSGLKVTRVGLGTRHTCRAKERSRGTCDIPKRSGPSNQWSQRRTKDQSNLGLQMKGVRANPDQPRTSTAHHAILTKQELWP